MKFVMFPTENLVKKVMGKKKKKEEKKGGLGICLQHLTQQMKSAVSPG